MQEDKEVDTRRSDEDREPYGKRDGRPHKVIVLSSGEA